jgi:hypothetical protein
MIQHMLIEFISRPNKTVLNGPAHRPSGLGDALSADTG